MAAISCTRRVVPVSGAACRGGSRTSSMTSSVPIASSRLMSGNVSFGASAVIAAAPMIGPSIWPLSPIICISPAEKPIR